MSEQIAIYGAGGFAREVAWLIHSCNRTGTQYSVVCFIDDNIGLHGLVENDIQVMSLNVTQRKFPSARVVGAIGNPRVRQTVMERAAEAGMETATFIHPDVELSRWIEIGEGTIICAGNILTTNIKLGKHVQINLDCTIGHNVIMEDYTTLAPGVHVSGWVHFEKRVYIGTGAVIINGTEGNPLIIGEDAVVGAGACVTRSVPANSTVVGVPAKPLSR